MILCQPIECVWCTATKTYDVGDAESARKRICGQDQLPETQILLGAVRSEVWSLKEQQQEAMERIQGQKAILKTDFNTRSNTMNDKLERISTKLESVLQGLAALRTERTK